MKPPLQILDSADYGPIVRVLGRELADAFDDFITENFYAFYDTKFKDETVEFYFGQFGSVARIKEIVDRFNAQNNVAITGDEAE
jgi:hypothetical protein